MRDVYKIAAALKQPSADIRIRFGSVVSVETNRTATVTLGGSTEQIPGVPYVASVVPQPGKVVIMLTDGVDLFILDHLSASNMTLSPRTAKSADLTLTTATDTLISWDSVNNDPWTCWVSGANASRLTAPVDGRFMAIGSAQFAANATGIRAAWIVDGSATTLARTQTNATSANQVWLQVVTSPFTLAKGEYIQMYVRQTSGGNLALTRDSTYTPSLSLIYLG